MRTDQLVQFSMSYQKAIGHGVMSATLGLTNRTDGFPFIGHEMIKEMQAVLVSRVVELLDADEASLDHRMCVNSFWLFFYEKQGQHL